MISKPLPTQTQLLNQSHNSQANIKTYDDYIDFCERVLIQLLFHRSHDFYFYNRNDQLQPQKMYRVLKAYKSVIDQKIKFKNKDPHNQIHSKRLQDFNNFFEDTSTIVDQQQSNTPDQQLAQTLFLIFEDFLTPLANDQPNDKVSDKTADKALDKGLDNQSNFQNMTPCRKSPLYEMLDNIKRYKNAGSKRTNPQLEARTQLQEQKLSDKILQIEQVQKMKFWDYLEMRQKPIQNEKLLGQQLKPGVLRISAVEKGLNKKQSKFPKCIGWQRKQTRRANQQKLHYFSKMSENMKFAEMMLWTMGSQHKEVGTNKEGIKEETQREMVEEEERQAQGNEVGIDRK